MVFVYKRVMCRVAKKNVLCNKIFLLLTIKLSINKRQNVKFQTLQSPAVWEIPTENRHGVT